MDFETEKILAKVAGENTENFAERVIDNSTKAQINFAFEQMFTGLSVLEWGRGVTLGEAWNKALDKMRDFIFSIENKNYIVDYLRVAVFEHRKQVLKTMTSSMHVNEYIRSTPQQQSELEKSANEKIQNGIDIIKSVLAVPTAAVREQKGNNNELVFQNIKEREHEKERTRK